MIHLFKDYDTEERYEILRDVTGKYFLDNKYRRAGDKFCRSDLDVGGCDYWKDVPDLISGWISRALIKELK